MITLTQKQAIALKFIIEQPRPTNLAIAKSLNLKTASSAQRRTDPLCRKKLIKNTGSGFISLVTNLDNIKVIIKKEIYFSEFCKIV